MSVVGQEIITTSQHPPLLESNRHSNRSSTSVCLAYHLPISECSKPPLGQQAHSSQRTVPAIEFTLRQETSTRRDGCTTISSVHAASPTQNSVGLPEQAVLFRAFGETACLPGASCHSPPPQATKAARPWSPPLTAGFPLGQIPPGRDASATSRKFCLILLPRTGHFN